METSILDIGDFYSDGSLSKMLMISSTDSTKPCYLEVKRLKIPPGKNKTAKMGMLNLIKEKFAPSPL
eukprot:5239796-Amphidinium_carterae.1